MVAPLALLGISAVAGLVGNVIDSIGSATSAGGTAGAAAPSAATAKDKLRKSAQDFETVFLEQTLDRLTEQTGEDGPLGAGGTGGSVYRSMLAKEYASQVVKAGGVGIAGSVYSQLLKLQEGAAHG